MQPLSRVADAGGELPFHEGMNILGFGIDGQPACVNIRQNCRQAGQNRLGILRGENARFAQHPGVGHGAPNILPIHPLIKSDGSVQLVQPCIHFPAHPSFPQLHFSKK